MEILEKLTPTETYLVQSNTEATFKELLKLTLADLCLKKVLVIGPKNEKADTDELYVFIGSRFQKHHPHPHEMVFLSPFTKSAKLKIHFKDMIKMAYENARNRDRYIFRSVIKNPALTGVFHTDFFTKLLGHVALTSLGKKKKQEVDKVLAQLSSQLPVWLQNDKPKAMEVIERIGGNVFLIPGLEFALLKEIDEKIAKELTQHREHYDSGCGGCYSSYYDHNDAFEGAFDSADSSSGGSGCGGDSGCSGCSGCGGCGD